MYSNVKSYTALVDHEHYGFSMTVFCFRLSGKIKSQLQPIETIPSAIAIHRTLNCINQKR